MGVPGGLPVAAATNGLVPTIRSNTPLTALTNTLGTNVVLNNIPGSSVTVPQLHTGIANLQVQIEQILPLVAAFNASLLGSSAVNGQSLAVATNGTSITPATILGATNRVIGSLLSNRTVTGPVSGSLAQTSSGSVPSLAGGANPPSGSLAQTASGSVPSLTGGSRASTAIAGSLPQTSSGSSPGMSGGNLNQGTLTVASNANQIALTPAAAASLNSLALALSTNGVSMTPAATLESLLALQNDMQQMLPILSALNGASSGLSVGSVATTSVGDTGVSGTLSNGFAVPTVLTPNPSNTAGTFIRPQNLTPTGR